MSRFNILFLCAQCVVLTSLNASGPLPQSMDAAMNAIVKDNETLRKERDALNVFVKQYQKARQPNCCVRACDSCGDKCSIMGDRADIMCNRCIAQPFKSATCHESDDDVSDVLMSCAKICVGSTCCLPYNIIRGLFCGTTYVCCGSECSATCLNLNEQ